MNLAIRYDGFEMTEPIDRHVRDRMSAALDQHASHVRSATVTVRDENGPRGGMDKSCRVQIDMAVRSEPVIVEKQHDNLYVAVTEAADVVKRTVGKIVGKAKDRR